MRKGIIITGAVFMALLFLLVIANYSFAANEQKEKAVYNDLLIDKTQTRLVDALIMTVSICQDKYAEIPPAGDPSCVQRAANIQNTLNTVLSNTKLDKDGITLTQTVSVVNTCPSITANVHYEVNAVNGMHKQYDYSYTVS
jgi:hypothetical protein